MQGGDLMTLPSRSVAYSFVNVTEALMSSTLNDYYMAGKEKLSTAESDWLHSITTQYQHLHNWIPG